MMRKIFFCLYLVVAVGVIFCLAESVLRFVDITPTGVFVPRFYSDVHGDLEPNMRIVDRLYPQLPYRVTATSQGTRGLTSFRPEKNEGTLRVLCLGDSFTFGFGVDDVYSYPELLQRELALRYPGKKIEVINAGLPLFGILDAMDYYLQKGAALKPDVVILQFFANDIQDMCREYVFREAHANDPAYASRSKMSKLLSGTKLYQLAANMRFAFGKITYFGLPISQEAKQKPRPNSLLDPYRFDATPEETHAVSERDTIAGLQSRPELSRVWDSYRTALAGFREQVRFFGSDMLFLCVPDTKQVEDRAYSVHQELAPALSALGMPNVDMLEPFRESLYGQGVQPYLSPIDDHCSPYGNLLIARAVAQRLHAGEDSAGRPYLRVKPGAFMHSRARPLACELLVMPGSVLVPTPDSSLVGRVISAHGLEVDVERSFAINAVRLEDTKQGEGELLLEFQSSEPVYAVEFRLSGYVGQDPELHSGLKVDLSLDQKAWKPLLDQKSTGSGRNGTYESHFMLDTQLNDTASRAFWLRIRMAGTSRLCTDRPQESERVRRMIVTAFPAGA